MGKLSERVWDEKDVAGHNTRYEKRVAAKETPLYLQMKLLDTLRQCAHELENGH